MTNEIKKLNGIIQAITDNSIKIKNTYIKFFDLKHLEGLKLGTEVTINYKENTKDGKLYRNGVSVEKVETVNVNPESKVNIQKLDSTIQNTILMVSRDIYNIRANDIDLEKNPLSYKEIVKEVLSGLKEIQYY